MQPSGNAAAQGLATVSPRWGAASSDRFTTYTPDGNPVTNDCWLRVLWDGLDAAELLSDFGDRIAAYGRYDDDA